ncbi:MAG: transposase [Gammaproteobacteria bacterium]|nr:transposase [Gammaproteobacteria bacterium]
MSRPLRIEFAGALYHVTSRGDGRDDIYLDDADRMNYLEVLSDVCDRFNWVVHAYCLMSNHYHLLIETPDSNLSKGMRQLNGVYTQRFNRKHNRVGHVFQGRYKAIIVQKESYLLELARYIVLNPVRAQMVRSARDWPWSSYKATAGFINADKWLTVNWILSSFARKKTDAVILYRAFVSEGRNQAKPWNELKNQIYLGDDEFIDEMQCKISPETNLSEIPSSQRRQVAKPLEYYEKKYSNRDVAILKAYDSGGYSMKIIGDYFELHYSRISRILKAKGKT